METYIQHVTVNTGHNHPYNRFECRPETIQACKRLIEGALKHQATVSFPDGELSHLRFGCFPEGRKLAVTVYGPAGPHQKGQAYKGDNVMPLCTFAVAPKSKDSEVWNDMCKLHQTVWNFLPVVDKPQAPFVAVVIYPTLIQYPESIPVLAEFERCMAWAWIEWLRSQAGEIYNN